MIEITKAKVRVVGDGYKREFEFPFRVVASYGTGQVVVFFKNISDTIISQCAAEKYSVEFNSNGVGGKIEFKTAFPAPDANTEIIICRNLPVIQNFAFANQGLNAASNIEKGLDY
jgi:hypothetical protein